eukprot:gb/GEZN01010376.1/.p1 GENE.gb/GEZN01010376.1/~~gb/GEZN01010376.1/.p1  ORF type:complete len:336 (-),score=30.32 gb/GEZN01010376.1/:39-1046(-)
MEISSRHASTASSTHSHKPSPPAGDGPALFSTAVSEVGESQIGTRPDNEGQIMQILRDGSHTVLNDSAILKHSPASDSAMLKHSPNSALITEEESAVPGHEKNAFPSHTEIHNRTSRGFTALLEDEPDPGSFRGPLAVKPGMSKEEIRELRIVQERQRGDRSGSHSVIKHAQPFQVQQTKRLRAFTSGQLEEKKARQQFSMTFQAITEIRSKAIEWTDLKDMQTLSSGMFGEVHTARFKAFKVVVKTLKTIDIPPDASEKTKKRLKEDEDLAIMDFKKEMSMLTKLWHRNIVHLIGVGVKPRLFMVMEYMAGGSLQGSMLEATGKSHPLNPRLVI